MYVHVRVCIVHYINMYVMYIHTCMNMYFCIVHALGWAQRNEVRLVKRLNFSFPTYSYHFSVFFSLELPRAGFQK